MPSHANRGLLKAVGEIWVSSVRKNGVVTTRARSAARLQEVRVRLGERPQDCNTHSLRIRAVTELVWNGDTVPMLLMFARLIDWVGV